MNLKLLGQDYKLNISESFNEGIQVIFDKTQFNVFVSRKIQAHRDEYVKQVLIKWFRLQAANIYKARVDYYAEKLKVNYNRITIKEQKTRWGSCSSKGNLNFNWRVIMAPIEIVDYLVVHELCHLVHMNHSKEFWTLVQSSLPDYEKRQQWLKENGNKLGV